MKNNSVSKKDGFYYSRGKKQKETFLYKVIPALNNLFVLLLIPIFAAGQSNYSAQLELYMKAQISVNDFNGAILLMKGGQPLLKKAYGLADREGNINNTVDTKFRIGSVTKQFTAASILLLEEKGMLSINDKLSKYFPDFPNGDNITLHLLLCHRSGIGDYSEDVRLDTLVKFIPSSSIMISYIKKLPFEFSPNSNYKYCNTNYYLLGCIIEKVSGKSYRDFVTENILIPLDMSNTSVESNEAVVERLARGYEKTKNGYVNEAYYPVELLYSAGAMYSTVEDLYKWCLAIKKATLLSKESMKKMYTPYTYNDIHYGYGAVIDTFQNHQRIWHSGGGWAFNANIAHYPTEDICVVVLSNNQSNSEGLSNALAAILFELEVHFPYHHKEYKINPRVLEKYTGKWVGEFNKMKSEMELYTKGNKLYRIAANVKELELIPESETKF